jgi:Rrf2 family protein
MPASTRFAVSIHLLTALAYNDGKPLASEVIAGSASTNPAVVRRLFSHLTHAGLVRAQLGQGGGFVLAKPAAEITLLQIFRAVEDLDLFPHHRTPPSADCIIGRHILAALEAPLARVERAFLAELGRTSLADIVADVRDRIALV